MVERAGGLCCHHPLWSCPVDLSSSPWLLFCIVVMVGGALSSVVPSRHGGTSLSVVVVMDCFLLCACPSWSWSSLSAFCSFLVVVICCHHRLSEEIVGRRGLDTHLGSGSATQSARSGCPSHLSPPLAATCFHLVLGVVESNPASACLCAHWMSSWVIAMWSSVR